MTVRPLNKSDDQALTAFFGATGAQVALAYHFPFYRDVMVEAGVGQAAWLGWWRDDRLSAVLPAFIRSTEQGSVWNSLPYFGANGGVVSSADLAPEAIPLLLDAAVAHMRARGDGLSMALYTPLGACVTSYTAALKPDVEVEKFTQVTALDGSPWSKSIRYDIRRAESLGVTVDEAITSEALAEFYKIYTENCQDVGIPRKDFTVISALTKYIASDGPVRLYFARQGGRMVAGLMMLWGPQTVSYYLPCTLASARALQPGSVLIDYAARDAVSHGKMLWNWESSPDRNSGVYRFKERWNAHEYPFRILIKSLCSLDDLRQIGREGLGAAFPNFFVYPFDRL